MRRFSLLPCSVHLRLLLLLLLLLVGRPGDVLQTRSGITVENGNTDAEVGCVPRLASLVYNTPNMAAHGAMLTRVHTREKTWPGQRHVRDREWFCWCTLF